MPPKSKPIDPNQPVQGSDQDATEVFAEQQAMHNGRRDRMNAPQQGDNIRVRGQVVEPIQQVTQNRGRPEASLQVQGHLINNVSGASVSDDREWTVVVNGRHATTGKEKWKAGDEVEAPGKWVETYRAGRFTIDSEIQATDVHVALDAGIGQNLGANVADSGAAGGVSAGL